MKYFFNKQYAALIIFLIPLFVHADGTEGSGTLETLTRRILDFINNTLIPLMVSIALLLFFFGIVRYFFSQGSIAKEEARKFLFWGIIALFVMTAVWGIIGLLTNFIGIGTVIPQLPTGH